FARREGAYYSAMFEAGVSLDNRPDLRAAGDRAFGILRNAVEQVITTLPAASRPPASMMALHIWSLSHGIASLFARGDAGGRRLPWGPGELPEAGRLSSMRGLARDPASGEAAAGSGTRENKPHDDPSQKGPWGPRSS